jgi:hypothetical protein
MSAEKAKAVMIERQQRAKAKVAQVHKMRLTARMQRAKARHMCSAKCMKNSLFCPDRPPLEQTVTDDLPADWYASADNADRLHGGQEGTTATGTSAGETPAPTLFILAHGVSTDAMAAKRKKESRWWEDLKSTPF